MLCLVFLNRDYKQPVSEIKDEFPFCHVLIRLEDALDVDGYLIAVSEEPEADLELCNYMRSFTNDTILYVGGMHKNGTAVGVQAVVG